MKKIVLIVLVCGLVVVACKAKKSATKSGSAEPNEGQLTSLKTKLPNATMEDLKKGHSIYFGACTNCHGAKDVTGYTEEKLQNTIERMAPLANLAEDEKEAVWKYALAVNLSAKK